VRTILENSYSANLLASHFPLTQDCLESVFGLKQQFCKMKELAIDEVTKHNTENDFWLVIDGKVYDITNFLAMHPGGEQILYPYGGKDVT
jgi:cytochrome b involved in lipid metabolism